MEQVTGEIQERGGDAPVSSVLLRQCPHSPPWRPWPPRPRRAARRARRGAGGSDPPWPLPAGEVPVGEVENRGAGERADPLGRPPPGEGAGAGGVLEREVAEDGVEEVVGEAAQPVLHGSAAAGAQVRFHRQQVV